MTALTRFPITLALACVATAAFAQSPPAKPAATPQLHAAARCAVWARELEFARSVHDHDEAAFKSFLHEDAVFSAGHEPTRGRDAITAQWKGIIDGSALVLEWYPDTVQIGGDGRTAYSSGPALFRNPKDGSLRRSRFGSVWQQGSDDQWRVIFDDGSAPAPTDDAGAKAFAAGRREACPSA